MSNYKIKNKPLIIPLLVCMGFSSIALVFNSITLYVINTLLYACLPFVVYQQYKKYYHNEES